MAKKSKKSKKSRGPYSDLSKKVQSDATASTTHLVGHEVELVLRNGLLVGDSMSVMLEHADDTGIRYSREWRGSIESGCMPMSAIDRIERKIAKGKGDELEQVPWSTRDVPGWASEHVGEWAAMTYDGDAVATSSTVLVGTVDGAGVGYCYSSYGSEKVGFRPHARVVDISFKLAADDEDDEDDE